MTDPTAPTAPTAPAPADNASVAEDFVDIFVSPSKVFARRSKASPMVPFLVVWIVLTALFFSSKNVLAPIFDAQTQKGIAAAMKANPSLTAEQMDKAKPIMNFTVNVAGVLGAPILLLIIGFIIWVVGRFILSGDLSFGTGLLIASFSFFPRIISSVIGLVEGLTMDVTRMTSPYQITVSASRFFDPATMSDGAYQLLGQLDLFAIWSSVLIAIGLMYAGKVEKSKAIVGAVILFAVGMIPALWALAKGA